MQARMALAPRGNGRRKIVVAGVLTALSFAVVVPMLAGGAAATTPSSDINDYALYAVQTLQLKGGGTAAQSQIDGNIAAGTRHWQYGYTIPATGGTDEYLAPNAFLKSTSDGRFLQPAATGTAHVTLCQGSGNNGHIDLLNGSYVVAPSTNVNINSGYCNIKSIYNTAAIGGSNAAVYHAITTPPGGPDIQIPPAPATPTCKAGTSLTVDWTMGTLPPGVYGDVTFKKGSTYALASGNYVFCSVTAIGVTVNTTPTTVINITGSLKLDSGTFGACGTVIRAGGSTVTFGQNQWILGTVIAPNSDVALGNGNTITGHVWSFSMHSDWGVNVRRCPPGTATTTTVSPTTGVPTTLTTSTTTSPTTTPPPTPPTTTAPTTVPPTTAPPTTTPKTTVPPTTTPPTTAPATTTSLGDT